MKNRFYFCDQKRACRNAPWCGVNCFMTSDREHKAAGVVFDTETMTYAPISYDEELRGYILEKEQEGNI